MTFKDAEALKAALERGEIVSYDDVEDLQQREQEQRLMTAVERAHNGETDWESLRRMMGRNELPDLLSFVWMRLPQDQLIKAVGDAWVDCEFPEQRLARRKWLPMFRAARYHAEDEPATPPDSIPLWRGGTRRTGMSWTADREMAEWFRHRFEHIGNPGKLWTISVGPERLLAHYHEKHRKENEYVIDSTGIRPKEVRDGG
jgi:hypothetical protein